jgi:hypothetical protein
VGCPFYFFKLVFKFREKPISFIVFFDFCKVEILGMREEISIQTFSSDNICGLVCLHFGFEHIDDKLWIMIYFYVCVWKGVRAGNHDISSSGKFFPYREKCVLAHNDRGS